MISGMSKMSWLMVLRWRFFAVDVGGEFEGAEVGNGVERGDGGAHGAGAVQAFAFEPLIVAALKVAAGDVVQDGDAEDVGHGVGAGDVAAFGADDEGELDFVVQGFGDDGVIGEVIVGADDGGWGFGEKLGKLGVFGFLAAAR